MAIKTAAAKQQNKHDNNYDERQRRLLPSAQGTAEWPHCLRAVHEPTITIKRPQEFDTDLVPCPCKTEAFE